MNISERLKTLGPIRRVVIKIGSNVLKASAAAGFSLEVMTAIVNDICSIEEEGKFQIILVSSGAVMAGASYLNLVQAHMPIPMKQAAAAVGQVRMMNQYERLFHERKRQVAQILLTHDDIASRRRYLNARNAITTLLELGIMPIINENDSAAVHEIKFGDNDTLAAMITSVIDADLLLILSDVEGLYESDPAANPDARLVEEVRKIDEGIMGMAGLSVSGAGVGGMKAKVMAAKTASAYGIPTWIISGRKKGSIVEALKEGRGGTFFHPAETRINRRKHWIAHILKPRGKITVDAGARTALVNKGKSLLPSGIVSVAGNFESGEAVSVLDMNGRELARGLVNYHSGEIKRIMGKNSSEIETVLGYKTYDEAMHRDNMIITAIREVKNDEQV